jgi:predicted amidophosphoribosyltransferase
MRPHDERETRGQRPTAGAGGNSQALDGGRRRLQRIVRSDDVKVRDISEAPPKPKPQPEPVAPKPARLSPELVVPAAAVQEECVQFQCTECDMMVKDSDPYCPFCGAIFADGPLSLPEEAAEASDAPERSGPRQREEFFRPERFDVFGMMRTRGKAHELLYQEATRGFAGSARLLEEIEHQISDISSLGTDTTRARRLMSSAWEACREGNWNLVSALARQTEDAIAPSIPALVRAELAKAREYLMLAKSEGRDTADYLLRMKAAMHCLKSGDDDEALRLTKELMDALRHDSIAWHKGGPPASINPSRSGA